MLDDLLHQLRRRLAELRHWPDQRAHAERRADALARAALIGRPRGVLVMCLGNICRSPYAEHRLRQLLAATPLRDVRVTSAGLIGPGRAAPELGVSVARDRGVDLRDHISRTLEPAALREVDVVLVMATNQAESLRGRVAMPAERVFVLGDFDPEPIRRREIHDPYHQEREVFEASYARIDRCLEAFVAALAGTR